MFMRVFQKRRWKLIAIAGVLIGVSIGFLISCNKDNDNDSPTSPGGDYCQGVSSCTGGGWLKACVKSNGCAYYLSSDGTRFNCDSCNVCDLAAQRAVNACLNY